MASMPENDDKLNGELYNALLKEEMKNVIKLCERVPDHAMHVVTIHNDTVLHLATYSKQAELVLGLMQALPHHLIEKMTTRKNVTGNTVLHEAATLDDRSVEIATKMLEKAPELLNICNELGESVLFQAARYGKTQIFNFLADIFSKYDEAKQKLFSQRTDKTTMLHIAILARHFDLALNIARRFGHIVGERDHDGMTALQLLSCNPSAFEPARRRGFLKRNSSNEVLKVESPLPEALSVQQRSLPSSDLHLGPPIRTQDISSCRLSPDLLNPTRIIHIRHSTRWLKISKIHLRTSCALTHHKKFDATRPHATHATHASGISLTSSVTSSPDTSTLADVICLC